MTEILTARREYGKITINDYPMRMDGRWVVRDSKGKYVNHDRYRNDLKAQYENLIVIDDEDKGITLDSYTPET